MALNPLGNPTFAKDAADTIERLVGTVRDKTTKPLVTAVMRNAAMPNTPPSAAASSTPRAIHAFDRGG